MTENKNFITFEKERYALTAVFTLIYVLLFCEYWPISTIDLSKEQETILCIQIMQTKQVDYV